MPGRSIRIFILGDDPQALKTVELGNWNGKAIFGRRRDLSRALEARDELRQPSIYFLLAPASDNPALTQVYVGETEDFSSRAIAHEKQKEWWEFFVVFVSKDSNLTKAHIRFLERWFHDRSREAVGRVRLMNENTPPGAKLPEGDLADMETFGDNALFMLAALGYRLFEATQAQVALPALTSAGSEIAAEFELAITRDHQWPDGTLAKGRLRVDPGGYVLLAGSALRLTPRDRFREHNYWDSWRKLVDNPSAVQRVTDEVGRLLVDTAFTSPSAAAAVVKAGATNGRMEWRQVGTGISLEEWEEKH